VAAGPDLSALSPASTADDVVACLRALGTEENRQGMQRFGIRIDRALGVSHGVQRSIAKKIKRNHARAFELWASGLVEAQFIAAITADPKRFTADNARAWAAEFDSWDIVDGVTDLFVDTDHWLDLIAEFAEDEREFVRRAAFAMMAWSVVLRKKEPDDTFLAGRCARSASARWRSMRRLSIPPDGWPPRRTRRRAGTARTPSAN
jgi:3-methyladenine DNA glycosylase AlkD